jgi:hypothetical protein
VPTPDEYREMAVQDFQTDGEIKVAGDPVYQTNGETVSVVPAAGGAWVQAWVWVDNDRFDNGEGDR